LIFLRKIYMYTDDVNDQIIEFLKKAHPKIRKKFDYIIIFLKDEKNILCEPYVKHFSIEKYKMFYERRLRAAGVMVRIIYYEAGNNIILLHAFYKHDKRDTEQALEYALKLVEKINDNSINSPVCMKKKAGNIPCFV
jgi:mRNA-degrading endonuclease RelE of RelBE toxin-antitoxin system